MQTRFTHCALHVQDMRRSVDFYREFCGLEVVREHGHGPNDHATCLAWEPKLFPYPVGRRCALRDPDGFIVEFSYGQPLGPGAAS